MSPGDYCFIGSAPSTRIQGYNKFTGEIDVYNNESYQLSSWDGCFNLPIDKSQHDLLLNYVYEFINKPIESWDRYWNDRFIDLTLILKKLQITPFYWTNNIWSDYEFINEHTRGKVDDGHWSINGHREFANDVLKKTVHIDE